MALFSALVLLALSSVPVSVRIAFTVSLPVAHTGMRVHLVRRLVVLLLMLHCCIPAALLACRAQCRAVLYLLLVIFVIAGHPSWKAMLLFQGPRTSIARS